VNHDIHDLDHQNIDGVADEDDDNDDDDDGEDNSEDDNVDDQNEVAASALRPRFPGANLASKGFVSCGAQAAITSAANTSSLDG
jgi:hypothetical protein